MEHWIELDIASKMVNERQRDISEAMKLEIGRMLGEGLSIEGIQVVMEAWQNARVNPTASYAAYVEYGYPPIDTSKTVEGSIIEPVTDERLLLPPVT